MNIELANHVLQFMFHGLSGFRFLVAHNPTREAKHAHLYSLFWDVIGALETWGFHVLYTVLDGASTNRAFIKMLFNSSPTEEQMSVYSPFSGLPIIFLADPSHLFKKMRNNILKSGCEKWHTRLLMFEGQEIKWKLWRACYEWDKGHGLSIHRKLTNEHLHPNSADKMRNHLAEEVLDGDMLHLMKCYQKHLGVEGGIRCSGAIALLEQTSILISIFRDPRPINDICDKRLHQLKTAQQWFLNWEKESDTKSLMSRETREDIQFLLIGFPVLVETVTNKLGHSITPMCINSDIVENNFSQQRGMHHGAGTNPNYKQYCYATNSIILAQNTISRKSNAARRKSNKSGGALPFTHLCKKLRI